MEQLRVAALRTGVILARRSPILGYPPRTPSSCPARLSSGRDPGPHLDLLVGAPLPVRALAFGLLISTIPNQVLAFQAGLIPMLPAILLSGFIFQIRVMPKRSSSSLRLPARYFLVILPASSSRARASPPTGRSRALVLLPWMVRSHRCASPREA